MRKIGQTFTFLILIIAVAALVVFLVRAGGRRRARLGENKALIMRFDEEVWKKRNWDVVDEIVASDYVRHMPGAAEDLHGREALKQFITDVYTAWPDLDFTAEIMIAEGDMVAIRYTHTGTHTGTAWGIPPSGNKVNFIAHHIDRIADGKIVEQWHLIDDSTLFHQMGMKLVPAK